LKRSEDQNKGQTAPGVVAVKSEPAPKFTKITIGTRLYDKAFIAKEKQFVVPAQAKIQLEISIDKPYQLAKDKSGYTLTVDGKPITIDSIDIKPNDDAVIKATVAEPLPPGNHDFVFQAQSAGDAGIKSTAKETVTGTVSGGPMRSVDIPIFGPNPYNPERDKKLVIQYTLSKRIEAKASLLFFDLTGRIVKKIDLNPGEEGTLDQLNKVVIDGSTDFGQPLSTGQYIVNLVCGNQVIFRNSKLTVYRGAQLK
jgi:hypothetical protein